MEHATNIGGGVGARQCGLRKRCRDECTEKVSGALAEAAFRKIADHNRTLVHQAAEGDGAARLRQHVAQARHHERLADLVLDRCDRLAAEAVGISGVLILPKCADDRITDMMRDERHPGLSFWILGAPALDRLPTKPYRIARIRAMAAHLDRCQYLALF